MVGHWAGESVGGWAGGLCVVCRVSGMRVSGMRVSGVCVCVCGEIVMCVRRGWKLYGDCIEIVWR